MFAVIGYGDLISEENPCFKEVTLVSGDKTRGSWLTLKRTNLDSCAFEPETTSILVTGGIRPIVEKTDKGWLITFPESFEDLD